MKLSQIKLPFDLKFCKLEGSNWSRTDNRLLAWQLMVNQGNERYSIENRIIIAFENSPTSSVSFLKRNEIVMLQHIMKMLKNPEDYWFKIPVDNKEIYVCMILIPEKQYIAEDIHEHQIGEGLREPKKAEFAHTFLEHITWVTDEAITAHNNPKEHGKDGYILLPKELITKLNGGS